MIGQLTTCIFVSKKIFGKKDRSARVEKVEITYLLSSSVWII